MLIGSELNWTLPWQLGSSEYLNYEGKKLNGPNDVWPRPDGGLYFTDPFYKREWWKYSTRPQDSEQVYFLSVDRKTLKRVTKDLVQPNGIIGTPDGRTLFVSDIGAGKTYAYDNSETNLFYYNWTQNHRVVTVRANVTDPFGGYDVSRVNMTILGPYDVPVVKDREMTPASDGQWKIHFSNMREENWSYPVSALQGNYTVKVSVTDNNGYYRSSLRFR
jgi:hypothetical protein